MKIPGEGGGAFQEGPRGREGSEFGNLGGGGTNFFFFRCRNVHQVILRLIYMFAEQNKLSGAIPEALVASTSKMVGQRAESSTSGWKTQRESPKTVSSVSSSQPTICVHSKLTQFCQN